MKKILITGKNSYIGTSFEKWMSQYPDEYSINSIDMKDGSWREHDFSMYDVVFHVAGIAHVSCNKKLKDLYYKVNRDLTIETAVKAKAEGVKQFIFMSSIIVYGNGVDKSGMITKDTIPQPKDFYGDSKLQAENGILPLNDENFKVVILRPPMIYGPGSKGNFPKLVKLAKITPIFPDIGNMRSILYIDNLCEFIKAMIIHGESGLFFPQNKDYLETCEIVKTVAEVHGKKLLRTKLLNPVVMLMLRLEIVKKVFGNLAYDKSLSDYDNVNYQIINISESLWVMERVK
ncbi:MAG: NAD-dependent epimerase [Firmicutes bacterium HGW-Firmicutes-10]|jgi:UDP-glucose 4-epimerase|nr:MAG: NAD-dependent epimerase [Firmicutes bacterium HGW-Firmicutes-10]